MNRELLVVTVGIPVAILDTFDTRSASLLRTLNAQQLLTRPLEFGVPYSPAFAQDTYLRMSKGCGDAHGPVRASFRT